MDLKQIHDLIKVVNKSNIGEISIEDKDGKVTKMDILMAKGVIGKKKKK